MCRRHAEDSAATAGSAYWAPAAPTLAHESATAPRSAVLHRAAIERPTGSRRHAVILRWSSLETTASKPEQKRCRYASSFVPRGPTALQPLASNPPPPTIVENATSRHHGATTCRRQAEDLFGWKPLAPTAIARLSVDRHPHHLRLRIRLQQLLVNRRHRERPLQRALRAHGPYLLGPARRESQRRRQRHVAPQRLA
jgi:hypothetical protein